MQVLLLSHKMIDTTSLLQSNNTNIYLFTFRTKHAKIFKSKKETR